MSVYQLLPHAEVDYLEAFVHLDGRNQSAALRWERLILEALDHISRYPENGHARPEIAPFPLRLWTVENYLIVYHPGMDPVTILAILHGAQDIPTILRQREGNHATDM